MGHIFLYDGPKGFDYFKNSALIKILLHCVQIFTVHICTRGTEPYFSGGVGVGVKSQSELPSPSSILIMQPALADRKCLKCLLVHITSTVQPGQLFSSLQPNIAVSFLPFPNSENGRAVFLFFFSLK